MEETKVCKRCNVSLPLTEYGFNGKFMRTSCKQCRRDENNEIRRSKEGVVNDIYTKQKNKSILRNHPKPAYTRMELQEWLFDQELFHEIYDTWTKSGYDKMERPSVDRNDDSIGYRFDNITLMTWRENNHKQVKNQPHNTPSTSKPILQYDMEDNFLKEYPSINEASRQTGIKDYSISKCCNKKQKTAGGFKWKTKETELLFI